MLLGLQVGGDRRARLADARAPDRAERALPPAGRGEPRQPPADPAGARPDLRPQRAGRSPATARTTASSWCASRPATPRRSSPASREIIDLPRRTCASARSRRWTRRSAFVPVVVAEHLTWDDVVRVSANAPVLPGVHPRGRPQPLLSATASRPRTSSATSARSPRRDLAKLEDPDPLLQIPRFQIGKTGVEQRLETALRGAGRRPAHRGQRRRPRHARARPRRGHRRARTSQLTIDTGLQNFAMQRMAGESAAAW